MGILTLPANGLRLATLLAAVLVAGCWSPRYLAQAAYGQLRMYSDARPIDEVIADPATPDHVRKLLAEVALIRRHAVANGLATKGNYRTYVDLNRSAAVWFVTTSKPLVFKPKVWCFPIVGCFPMLGWFDKKEALRFRKELRSEGWEVYMRGADAYSTAGWFKDAIVSTMLFEGEHAVGDLVNVVFHELVHANVLIPDQAYFNESVATFIADGMTATYLAERFGNDSDELRVYRADLEASEKRGARMLEAYEELERLYQSDVADEIKLGKKKAIFDRLEADVRFVRRPNNATLVGIRTYRIGADEFAQLLDACGGEWARFIAAVKTLKKKSFREKLQEDMAPVILPLAKAGCRSGQRYRR